MPKHKIARAVTLLSAAILANCSNLHKTKQFESSNKWFELTYPAAWQVAFEDGIYTFTATDDPTWAFQISAYKAIHDTIPDFDINAELQHTAETHPAAKIIDLPHRKAVYYTERRGASLLHAWVIGGKRCKAFCTYTAAAPALQNTNFNASQQAVDTMKIQ